ncbi:hypothetical protein ACH4Y0_00020 [Streptomyces sp. NPDC020707]|uniref:Uncharacterized protein n=1 Tax=Streptomyces ortus TaxID=2867268 RepID=A0ABT3UUE6_9ACTN|nr:hypothetical protein [Streptomyces ortus]MCX4231187.1 hypothetical protein [Streptomyces ortus]
MFKKFMQTAAALTLAVGAVTGAAATAQAGEQTNRTESAAVQSVQWQGPFSDYATCVTVQSEFRRYYTITKTCAYYASSGYYFAYDNGS